jgi:arylsulfatase
MFKHLTKIYFTLALAATCIGTSPPASAAPSLQGSRPNIVLIMPDDISYGAIQAYGGEKPTPYLDSLYQKSLRFENYQVSPTCSPTRAALMTGRHECYAGVTHTVKLRDRMSLKSRTVADLLKASGYATGIFGKWHLGDGAEYRPEKRGFDEVYIHGGGGISQNYPHSADFPNNDYNNPVLYHNGTVVETKGYCTDLFFDQAIRWIGDQKGKKPFFCYLPTNVNHTPKIPPILPDGSEGDILTNLDDNIGKMMAYLDTSGLSENTLLLYMGDNGGSSGRKQLRSGKTSMYEGGTRVPCLVYWKGKIEGGKECQKLTAHIDWFLTFSVLAGSKEPTPGDKPWDGRSLVPLLENLDADWPNRLFITHQTRWDAAATAQYSNAAIRDDHYKLVFPKGKAPELYDITTDIREQHNLADQHPDIVARLKQHYDAWWADIQPHLVNDHLTDVPATHKPFHDLYRQQLGQERFDAAMRAMTWSYERPRKKKP